MRDSDEDPLYTREQAMTFVHHLEGPDEKISQQLFEGLTFPVRKSVLVERGAKLGFSVDHAIDRMGGSP